MNRDFDIDALVRPNIRELVPYASARDEFTGSASIFLDANENPFENSLNRYPDPGQAVLKEKLAGLKQQEAANLFLGNGSDEAIDLLFRVFCRPGVDNVITVDPTYGMYRVCADVNDVEVKPVLLNTDFSMDPERVLAAIDAHTRLIFLCSPNNPTGNAYAAEALTEIIDQAPCMIVVDEAYADFSSVASLLARVPGKANLVVLQTLSKAWGLAGIRLGMAFAHPRVISLLTAVKYPYNVNALTMAHAMEALDQPQLMEGQRNQILAERDLLARNLEQRSCIEEVHPSDANFLLVRTTDARSIYDFMIERGIILRDRSGAALCSGCLRITVGTPEENQALMLAFDAYEAQLKQAGQ